MLSLLLQSKLETLLENNKELLVNVEVDIEANSKSITDICNSMRSKFKECTINMDDINELEKSSDGRRLLMEFGVLPRN